MPAKQMGTVKFIFYLQRFALFSSDVIPRQLAQWAPIATLPQVAFDIKNILAQIEGPKVTLEIQGENESLVKQVAEVFQKVMPNVTVTNQYELSFQEFEEQEEDFIFPEELGD